MKFRGTFGAPVQLSKLVTMLAKLSDSCVVHMTPEIMAFAIAAGASAGVQVGAELSQKSLFLEHRIESRAENNRISFLVKLDNLGRALKSCCQTQTQKTQVKLTKKMNGPTLTFEIVFSDAQVQVMHDVPIRLVQDPHELHAYAEPVYSSGLTAMSVVLPQAELRGLRNVAERMKAFSDYVHLTATDSGSAAAGGGGTAELKLEVDRDNHVSISTTYTKLERVSMDGGDPEEQQSSELDDTDEIRASASLELKRLVRVLQSLINSDLKIHSGIACVIPEHAVVLKVFLPSADERHSSSLVFYLPVQCAND